MQHLCYVLCREQRNLKWHMLCVPVNLMIIVSFKQIINGQLVENDHGRPTRTPSRESSPMHPTTRVFRQRKEPCGTGEVHADTNTYRRSVFCHSITVEEVCVKTAVAALTKLTPCSGIEINPVSAEKWVHFGNRNVTSNCMGSQTVCSVSAPRSWHKASCIGSKKSL